VSARGIFTHNMRTDVLTLHDFLAAPVGGGKLRGSGQLWLAPWAEKDPQALHIRCDATGLAAKEIFRRYIPDNVELPKVIDPGATNFRLTMKGSHSAPVTRVKFEAPEVQITGEASLSRSEWKATAKAPDFKISGTMHTQFPDFDSTKNVFTQPEMTRLCRPKINGVESEISLKGCDMLPLFAASNSATRAKSGQAVRLKVSGKTSIKARRIQREDDRGKRSQKYEGEFSLSVIQLRSAS